MLYNYNEEKKYAQHIILTAEDGTEYKGEFIDLRIDRTRFRRVNTGIIVATTIRKKIK